MNRGNMIEVEPPYLVIKPGIGEEEFYRTAGEDSPWELLDGRMVMHSPASDRHQDFERFLLTLLSGYLDERPVGVVRSSRYPMRLDERWSPEPDLLVVLAEHRERMTPHRLEGPADWVIEICSESDPEWDYREKLPRYRAAGIPEIWIVDPFQAHIHVEAAGGAPRIVRTGRLESAIVRGFWIEADWLWQPRLPSTMACLRKILGL